MRNVNDVCGYTFDVVKPKRYKPSLIGASFYYSVRNDETGLRTVETMSRYIKPSYLKYAYRTNKLVSMTYDGVDVYNGYVADGESIGYNSTKAVARIATSFVLGAELGKYGAACGLYLGGPLGCIVGGVSGGICGSLIGSFASDSMVDYLYNNF